MSKQASEIKKWGVVKPFLDKIYKFNTIDIETVDNELFILGYTLNDRYHYTLDNFYNTFHDLLIKSVQDSTDILTWSRYDNTHLVKLLLHNVLNVNNVLVRIGKVSPVYSYMYKGFIISIDNIIKDSMIFSIKSRHQKKAKRIVIYNLKNLFTSDLEETTENYELDYYTKIGTEYHIIDKNRYFNDLEYQKLVLESNRLDNVVIKDIANRLLENFKKVTGYYPRSIYTAGSLARSWLVANRDSVGNAGELNYKVVFSKSKYFNELLDYSMQSYHGGKIESYVLGYIPKAKIIDITSAYPYAMSLLPKITGNVRYFAGKHKFILNHYFYAFIKCNITIKDPELIHPVIIPSPINKSNISPYGYLKDVVITKIEYDYLLKKDVEVDVIDFYVVEHVENEYPYKIIVDDLFEKRLGTTNKSLSELFKTIINSLYGITYELTDIYSDESGKIEWVGYRAGDYFNPVIASYITGFTRTYLSDVSHNIVQNGGSVFLNMTDSIIYNGNCTLDVFSELKTLGKFEPPKLIKDVIILGAGRYEFQDELTKEYTIKNRGFSVSVKKKSFYSKLKLNDEIKIKHRTFVSSFKATTKKFSYKQLGHLIDDTYNINPFNLGGKRFIENYNVNLNKEYTRTLPVYIEKDYYNL